MVKRELIDREKAENTTWEEPSYTDALNVLTEVRDKIRELPTITEQEIVKPYLEELKSKMKERDDDNGGEPLNAVDRGYHLACEHLCKEIDNLLSESEGA